MSSLPPLKSVRWPISTKIFGVSVVLLVLMIVVTLLTSMNFRRVGEQLSLLSDYYIELDQLVGDVRIETLREVIQIERVLHARPKSTGAAGDAEAAAYFKEAGDCSAEKLRPVQDKVRKALPDRAERRLMNYRINRLCTNARLERALRLADLAIDTPAVRASPEQVARFTTIKNELGNIAPVRAKLHASFEKYLAELKQGDEKDVNAAQERIDEHRAELNRRVRTIAQLLHKGTRESAELTEELELRTRWLSWSVTLVACTLGLLFAWLISRSLVRPVRELLGLTHSIRGGNLDVHIQIRTADEIAQLADSFNHMVVELKQKEMIKQMFGKYVDPRVVQTLLSGQKQLADAGERQTMSVFFSDLEGFTTVCEGLTPTSAVKLMNRYFSLMAEAIRAEQGIIDKYIGDSVMAYWGPPFCEQGRQAVLACHSALAQQQQMEVFRGLLPEVLGIRRNIPVVNARMGIATGDVTVGSIGSEDARSYTVIGDTVNLASRLEGVNKRYGTRILINDETRRLAGDAIEVREVDAIRVVGRSEPVHIFELLGRKGDVAARAVELRGHYERGLDLYRKRSFAEARSAFEAVLAVEPADGPAKLFLERLRALAGQALPEAWDGITTFTEK